MPAPAHLVDRRPAVAPSALIAALVPPPLFADASFSTFRPDPAEPSQSAALRATMRFADSIASAGEGASSGANIAALRSHLGRRRRRAASGSATGLYLDGGFGVGKTHLLAALWNCAPQPKAYATFAELTQLVGALGFAESVAALAPMRLLCIDEFELDDPGDTVLVSSLLQRVGDAGTQLAATSNTLPDRLGEGRFAADDFLREIQGLAARFSSIRIDGPDFRHRGLPSPPAPLSSSDLLVRAQGAPEATLDQFDALLEHLSTLHPSRYGALLDGVGAVFLDGVHGITDQNMALRLVVLTDRLYDRQIPVLVAGDPLDAVFAPSMLEGGYRNKYRRALSRLIALNRLASDDPLATAGPAGR
jgi:cell division protein ZapE